jgi:hypothetical protein
MKYSQSKELVEELLNISILFHGSPTMLRTKIYDAIDKHIPDLDPACMERGCTCIDGFKDKNEQIKNT